MIKVIRGTVGVERRTAKSAPFTLSAEAEARLVKLGVAKYVEVPEAVKAEKDVAEKPAKTAKSNGKKAAKK